jgi:hypothetical protein
VGERNEDRSLGDLRLTTCDVALGLYLETWLFQGDEWSANLPGPPKGLGAGFDTDAIIDC